MMRVVHCARERYDVYIGRPSIWGNPFKLGPDGSREEVIKKYKDWLMGNTEVLDRLHELKDKTLGCWCKPHACHGDVLVQALEALEDEDKQMRLEFETEMELNGNGGQ
jgi:hypothetical protein